MFSGRYNLRERIWALLSTRVWATLSFICGWYSCHKISETTMVSEIFFYFPLPKVGLNFERNPLICTLTHITMGYSGQGSTNGCSLITKFPR